MFDMMVFNKIKFHKLTWVQSSMKKLVLTACLWVTRPTLFCRQGCVIWTAGCGRWRSPARWRGRGWTPAWRSSASWSTGGGRGTSGGGTRPSRDADTQWWILQHHSLRYQISRISTDIYRERERTGGARRRVQCSSDLGHKWNNVKCDKLVKCNLQILSPRQNQSKIFL